jgi:ribose transport system permease protein
MSFAAVQRDHPVAQVLILVVLFCLGAATIDGFTSSYSLRAMLLLAALLGISALGQTVCLLLGGLDVSVPSWILAGATITVSLLGPETGWTWWQVFLLLGVAAVAIGGLTGLACHQFGVPALVLTLAVGAMVQGAVLVWSPDAILEVPPQWIARATSPATSTFGIGLPPVVFIWAVVIVAAYLVLQRSIVGAWVHATGSNHRAAELAVLPTRWVWAGAFALSALSAVTAGVLLTGFSAGGDVGVGTPYLWNGLTAVLVGGTAFGTRGNYTRTAIGAAIVVVLGQLLTGWGLQPADQSILFGALIIVVVGVVRRDRRLRDAV